MPRTRWTEEQQATLLECLAKGMPDSNIAEVMGLTERQIRYRRVCAGKASNPCDRMWAEEEKRQLEEYVKQGLKDAEIAKLMHKRSRSSIHQMRVVLGLCKAVDAHPPRLQAPPNPHTSPRVLAARERAEAVLAAYRQRLQTDHLPGEPVKL